MKGKFYVVCSECGEKVESGQMFIKGEKEDLMPFFCSKECCNKYDPNVLTLAKINSLRQWLVPN